MKDLVVKEMGIERKREERKQARRRGRSETEAKKREL